MELTQGHWDYIRHEARQRYEASLLANKDPNMPKVDNSPKDTDSEIEKAIKDEVVLLACNEISNTIKLIKAKLVLMNTMREFEEQLDRILENPINEDHVDEDPIN